MDDIRALFLRQSLVDCEDMFYESIARPDTLSWDWMVVTAASEAQAAAYRAQIDHRLASGLLPSQTRYAVIVDPDGKRVGSGGATLNVMREIARREGDGTFAQKRILVLHSGGDSQRIPQYSALGKLFARVPRALRDGRASTLFDEFCIALSCVPPRMNGGMLLMSGDVLLLFNALQIDLERAGAACLSIKAPVSVGTRHGVFLSDGKGGVQEFLHKQPEAVLRARGAVNQQDMVDIDTGAIWLDEQRVQALYGLVAGSDAAFDAFVNEEVRLSLYGDIVYPMSGGATLESYLAQTPENTHSEALAACRRAIWKAIGDTRLSMIRMAPAEFIHFGTTQEWRDLLLAGEARFPFLGWRRDVMSLGVGKGYAAINSIIDPNAKIGEGCAIEDSHIGADAVIGEGCVVSGASLREGELAPGTTLHVLPIDGDAVCHRTYGVADNPKEALWFGKPLPEPLWTAQVQTIEGRESRISLRDGFRRADLHRILSWQEGLADDIRARRVLDALEADTHVREVLRLLSNGEARRRQLDALDTYADAAVFPMKHKLYYTLARALEAEDPQRALALDDACWQAINDHLLAAGQKELAALPEPRIQRDRAEVRLPVRVNWGGGWSDTPPYCLQYGGTVLNTSLLLDGKRPVHALAERTDDLIIRIESEDLGVYRDYTQLEALRTGNPHDPHALCKAALVVCGVIPDGQEGPLGPILARLGGGIRLRTAVDGVPKGSGLGTSSVVSAAVARALSQLLGQPDDDERIASLALCMEQLMNTGGGWQDQVGGLIPGIKLTNSHPGTPQKLSWRKIVLSDEAFDALRSRSVLVFTGQRRLARGILREIMGKAVANEPETIQVLSAIQRLAVLMAFELETGDIDQFAHLLREHWALSKRLDADSSNTCIDSMLTVVDDLIDGMMICGAGGGGFMYMVLKKGATKQQLSARLEGVFQESGVKVWDAELER